MAVKAKEKTLFVTVSGWCEEEYTSLAKMVEADGVDRSKFIRGLVREEWRRRAAQAPAPPPAPPQMKSAFGEGGKGKQ